MTARRVFLIVMFCIFSLATTGLAAEKKSPLDAWKPSFDPSGAKYRCIFYIHPVIKGVYAGIAMRDELWKRTNGQIYIDYKFLAQLGGEVEVLNQLQMGAIQGMGVSFGCRYQFRTSFRRGQPAVFNQLL